MNLVGITISNQIIIPLLRKYSVKELFLFGSVLTENFRKESDVDFLVTFMPNADISLLDMISLKNELENIIGRKVDLLEKDAIRNPYRLREIQKTARKIYAA